MKPSTIVEAILDGPNDPLKDFALNTPRNHKLTKNGDGTYGCACGRWGYSAVDVSPSRAREEYSKHVKHYGKYDECHGMLTMSTIRDIQHRIVDTLISGPAPSGWLLQEDVYKFSCTQIQAPADIAGFLMQWGKQNIPEENLYYDEKGDNGREVEPHVTVKYGLQIPAPNQALLQIIGTTKPFKVKLGLVSLFENPKFDVVKVDVDSPELHQLNRAISEAIPCKDTFPDYHPHMTIAYVKKGTGRALNGKNVFVDAPDVGSAFWAGNILFTGSGDGDDPDRVKQIIDFDHSKGPGDDLDESEELKDFARSMPQWTVAMHKRGREPLYVTQRGIHWVAAPQLARRFGTEGEAQQFLQLVRGAIRYNRDQLFVRQLPPLSENFDPKEFARDTPLPLYKVAFMNGPKYWDATWQGRWTPDIEAATGYSWRRPRPWCKNLPPRTSPARISSKSSTITRSRARQGRTRATCRNRKGACA
jgi:hypothetical protein